VETGDEVNDEGFSSEDCKFRCFCFVWSKCSV